jgi:uncharacterized protein YjbI with pentapeptide repeats
MHNRQRPVTTDPLTVQEAHSSGGTRRARASVAVALVVTLGILTGVAAGEPRAAATGTCVPSPKAILVNCNFDTMNLHGAQLADSNLAGASFVDADLSDAHLTSAQLVGADLARANLTHATMAHAHIERSNVTGTVLAAELYRVFSGGLIGKPAKVPRGWTLVDGYLIGPTAKLPYAKLAKADLAGAHLADADLFGADLARADLSHARLIGAHLGRTELQGANLSYADARATELRFANLNGANLTGAVIRGSNLRSVRLDDAKLVGVVWLNDVCPDGTQSTAPAPRPSKHASRCVSHAISDHVHAHTQGRQGRSSFPTPPSCRARPRSPGRPLLRQD